MKSTTTLTMAKVQVQVRWRDRAAQGRQVLADGACPVCKRVMPAGVYAVKAGNRWACQGCADKPSLAVARREANRRLTTMLTDRAIRCPDTRTLCWRMPPFPGLSYCTDCGTYALDRYARVGTADVTSGARLCVLCVERRVRKDARAATASAIAKVEYQNRGDF